MFVRMINQHLKACTSQREEEGQRTDKVNKHSFRIKSPPAMSPDSSHCAIFNCHPHISDHRDNMAEGKNLQITLKNIYFIVKCYSNYWLYEG